MTWQIEAGRSCSSLKRSLSEWKQSSSVMKNQNLKLKFMSWSISSSWQYFLRLAPKASVHNLLLTNYWISMKQSRYSACSNWSSMQLQIQRGLNFSQMPCQQAQILVFRKAFSIFLRFQLCRHDFMATISILCQNSCEVEERRAMLSLKVVRLRRQAGSQSPESRSKSTARICRLLEERRSGPRLQRFSRMGMLAWQRIMNSFLRQLQQESSCGLARMIWSCWLRCSSISKESTSVLSLKLHFASTHLNSLPHYCPESRWSSKLTRLRPRSAYRSSKVVRVNLVVVVISLNLRERLAESLQDSTSAICVIYFYRISRCCFRLVRHRIQRIDAPLITRSEQSLCSVFTLGLGSTVRESLSICIILITNKMKIITQLQLVGRLLHTKPVHLFSNLFKDSPLHFQDLVSRPSGAVQEATGKGFNMSSRRFNSPISTAIPTAQEAAHRKQQALEFMEKAIAKIGPQKEVRTRFERQGLNQEERKDNTALLMKYIDHILERPLALEVIRMVEKYCQPRRPSQMELTVGLMVGKFYDEKDEANLFKNLYDYLYRSLNFYSEDIQTNSQLIDSLLELLARSEPFQITTDSYMHGSFSIEDEDISAEAQGQVMFEFAAGGKYFQEANEEDKEGKEGNKYKIALEEAFRLKDRTKFSKLYLRKTAEVEDGKSKEQKLRVATEKVFFHKKTTKLVKNTGPKQEDLRSAYIYELPFTINEAEAEEFIHFLESSQGIKVESYALFPYKNFIEKQHLDIVFRVPERFTDKNVHMERIVRTVDIDEFTIPNTAVAAAAKKGKRTKKSEFDSVPLENEPHRRKSVTEALLLKIKKESYSKFNKSSMLLKFASRQDKEAVLTPESRLYGVNYKHFRNIKFQQGFCKTSVSLIGIPWGCSSKQLQNHLNQALQQSCLSIRVEQNCILTKSSIAIQFQHLSEAILAVQRLNNLTFQNKPLRAHLSYGSCKVNNSQYNTSIDETYDKLKLKIEQSGAHYSRMYQAEESQPSK